MKTSSTRRRRVLVTAALGLVCVASQACSSNDGTGIGNPGGALSLAVGATAAVPMGRQLEIAGGAGGGEYVLVVTDTSPSATGTSSYRITATGVSAPGSVSPPAMSRLPASADLLGTGARPPEPALDVGYGVRLNERYRRRFTSLLRSAQLAPRSSATTVLSPTSRRSSTTGVVPQTGDLLSYNVSPSACDSIQMHAARVMAVGSVAIVAEDTLDPPGGFTAADYQRFAANFDTLVYPLDVANFGAPTDIDQNAHVVLLFTRAVNELTPRGSQSFVGGFFFARDLFPHTATATLQACPGSNLAEMFYLLAPDPAGLVNGNVRTTGFIDSMTTSLVGHEFQHLINASRRIYVNHASDLEVVWLNEGLSHIAEELLFYHEAGLAPRQNITAAALRASTAARMAFNTDQASNAARYRTYLSAPSTNSPIRNDDSLGTRGATWDFLRYAADRKAHTGAQDTEVFQALVNSTTTGVANLRAVFSANIGAWLRDWSVSNYTDDVVSGASADLTQPSWNWHDIYPALGSGGGSYPLLVSPLTTPGGSGSLIPGAAAFYRFAVSPNGDATLTVSGGSAASGYPMGTVVRVR